MPVALWVPVFHCQPWTGTVRVMFFHRHLGAKFEWRVAAEENGTLLESCVSELKGVSTREFEYQTCGRRWAASHVLSYRGRSPARIRS